jgi:Transposase
MSCPPPGTVKEQLHRLLASTPVETARTHKMILGCYVLAADMDETWRLCHTIEAWWSAIELLITYRVTNARTEAANTGIKHIKTHRPGIPKSCPLPSPNPAHQRRQTRGVTH